MAKPILPTSLGKRKSGQGNTELAKMLSNGELKEVELNLVDRDDGQPRPLTEVLEGIEEFADELERDDFVLAQHPVFHIEDNGRYTIVVGERRTTAFRMKGRESIPAVCKKFTADERKKIFVMQYAENDGKLKKLLSPIADAKWWRTFIDRYHGGNVASAAKDRGRTESDISNRLSILDAPEEITEFALASGLKDPATFAGLVRIAKRGGMGVVKQIIKDFEAGEIKGSFRSHVAAMAKLINQDGDVKPLAGQGTKPNSNKANPKSDKTKETASQVEQQQRPGLNGLIEAIALLDKARLSSDLLDSESSSAGDSFKTIINALEDAQAVIKESTQLYKAELTKFKQANKNVH